MKKLNKTTLIGAVIAAGILLTSCQTAKRANSSSPDSYDAPTEKTETAATSADTSSEDADSLAKNPIQLKKKTNAIQDFFSFGNKQDYVRYDASTIFVKEITGKVKERDADLYLRTDNYMAGFGSYYLAAYYIVQFDEENKKKLATAVNNYLNDFENKRLNRKGKKTEKAYGKINYRLDWGSISSTTPNHGSGDGYLGYEFVKGSPYFTISNYPFKNDYYDIAGDSTSRESLQLKYYFTKAQAKALVERTSDSYIRKILTGTNELPEPTAADEY